jgi:hypothetical protein
MTDHEHLHHRELWQRRDAAMRNPVLETIWRIVARGVTLSLDERRRVLCSPPGSLTPEEIAELKANRDDVKVLVALINDEAVVPRWEVQ